MRKLLAVAALVGIVVVSLALGDVKIAHGTDVNPVDGIVKGVWRIVDSPFYVKSNPANKLEVPTGETLTIEAGVAIYFDVPYSLAVRGKLFAGGTRDNRITFSYRDGGSDRNKWGGIILYSTSGGSTITYCNIMNAIRAISVYGSLNNILTFNIIRYNSAGIFISAAEGNTITDNEIYECSDSAICLSNGSQRNDIYRNTIYKIGWITSSPSDPVWGKGIVINNSLTRLGGPMNIDNKIKDNTVYNCHLSGIEIDHVRTLEISGNFIYANHQRGVNGTGGNIYLRRSNDTYLVFENEDIIIHNNKVHSAARNGTGIYLQSVRSLKISYNDIYLNSFAGIVSNHTYDPRRYWSGWRGFSAVAQGQIFRNNLRNNGATRTGWQAWDNGESMIWDDGSKGNYWSDYNSTQGVDSNNDGIGDFPYTVPGYKGAKDAFPLVNPAFFIVTTMTTWTTVTATSTMYRLTTTTTIPTHTITTIEVPLTRYTTTFTTWSNTTISTTTTTYATTSYTLALTTFFATSTSYIWTVSASATTTLYSTSYTSTTTTTTTTSTTTSTTATTTTMTATQTVTPRRCVIASAAYGSELSPSVQFLRDFRDHEVLSTFAGAHFMKVFDAFYYSFSPFLAESVSASNSTRAAARALLAPLLGSLHLGQAIFRLSQPRSEFGVLIAGLISSSLIGLLYASPIIALSAVKAKDERKKRGVSLRPLGLVWLGSLAALGIAEAMFFYLGETATASFIAMVSTGTLVLSTMILAPLLLLKLIRRFLS